MTSTAGANIKTRKTAATMSVGGYIAQRLVEMGVGHYFSVPGDYNLVLFDELLKNENMKMIACCNELNAGYAADGYARACGIGAAFVTFGVGGLSIVNAVAGAYAEDLPVIVVSGGPNSNDSSEHHLIHHSLAQHEFTFSRDIFKNITAEAVIIDNIADAPALIERALTAALRTRKPVYIEIACNLATAQIPAPQYAPITYDWPSDPVALKAAVEAAASMLNSAVKPVLVAGVRLRSFNAIDAFESLANACDYGVAVMPNAKGFFRENHPNFIGMYLGQVSTPGCSEIVESADAYLFAGPLFTDYTTTGYTTLIDGRKLIEVLPGRVRVPGHDFSRVNMPEFLSALAKQLKKNNAAKSAYDRVKGKAAEPEAGDKQRPLTSARLRSNIQKLLDKSTCLVAETGDSWFAGLKMSLPEGANFEFQMQWGSIGWATPAVLGLSLAYGKSRRVIAMIGDGSFQLTAQEVSTMIRYSVNPIIFLINNGGYTIEAEIHDGPYNTIKNWNYADLVQAFNASDGNGFSARVANEAELEDAIAEAVKRDAPSLIECIIDRDDCTKQLLQLGSRVAATNARPPKA